MTANITFADEIEKRDLFMPGADGKGKCVTIRIRRTVWDGFAELALAKKMPSNKLALEAQREHNGTLAEAIEAYVLKHRELRIYRHREEWLARLVDAMRPVFAARDIPCPTASTRP